LKERHAPESEKGEGGGKSRGLVVKGKGCGLKRIRSCSGQDMKRREVRDEGYFPRVLKKKHGNSKGKRAILRWQGGLSERRIGKAIRGGQTP